MQPRLMFETEANATRFDIDAPQQGPTALTAYSSAVLRSETAASPDRMRARTSRIACAIRPRTAREAAFADRKPAIHASAGRASRCAIMAVATTGKSRRVIVIPSLINPPAAILDLFARVFAGAMGWPRKAFMRGWSTGDRPAPEDRDLDLGGARRAVAGAATGRRCPSRRCWSAIASAARSHVGALPRSLA